MERAYGIFCRVLQKKLALQLNNSKHSHKGRNFLGSSERHWNFKALMLRLTLDLKVQEKTRALIDMVASRLPNLKESGVHHKMAVIQQTIIKESINLTLKIKSIV